VTVPDPINPWHAIVDDRGYVTPWAKTHMRRVLARGRAISDALMAEALAARKRIAVIDREPRARPRRQ